VNGVQIGMKLRIDCCNRKDDTLNKDIYLATFKNSYGEDWWFDYNEENDMGILWGVDVDYKHFYVFDGICSRLIFDPEEKEWLKTVWNTYSKNKNIYLNDTEIQHNNKYTYLTKNYCPICLQQKNTFENHHCVPSSEGGSDDYVNRLIICNSCHSLITNGCYEDRYPRFLTAVYHQSYVYGIDFYTMNPKNNKRYKKDTGLYKQRPFIKKMIETYNELDVNEQIDFNKKIKQESLYYYKYFRSIVKNIITENLE